MNNLLPLLDLSDSIMSCNCVQYEDESPPIIGHEQPMFEGLGSASVDWRQYDDLL